MFWSWHVFWDLTCMSPNNCLTNVKSYSLAFISLKQNGSQQKQNDDFVVPIICYKVDNRAKTLLFSDISWYELLLQSEHFSFNDWWLTEIGKTELSFHVPKWIFFSERFFLCMVKEKLFGKYQLICVIHETITTRLNYILSFSKLQLKFIGISSNVWDLSMHVNFW